jgi:hypothetical protein
VAGGNGVYRYGASAFPNQTFDSSNYWVDVVFGPSALPTATPVPATATPVPTTPTSTPLPMTPTDTPPPATPTNTPLPVTPTDTPLPVTPTSTAAPAYSLWGGTAVPATASVNDPNAVELGVKFRAGVDGYVTGLRFYKGSANTGTHVGHLWTAGGTLLAQVTFAGETASGWQTAFFATPVAITANTVYVASYHTDVGNFAVSRPYFTSGYASAPLYAFGNSEVAGGNGVYRYGASAFPNQTFDSSNYWVDVVFTR